MANYVTSALGALGRRFESYRPDQSKPSHKEIYLDSLFNYLMFQIAKGNFTRRYFDFLCAYK